MKHCKRKLINAFNKNAATYNRHAFVQKTVAQRLLERLSFINQSFDNILEVGCGTGHLIPLLRKIYSKSNITGIDIAVDQLIIAKKQKTSWLQKKSHYVNADIEQLPFQENQFDLIISNLALHWCDAQCAFKNLQRVLKPGGLILFTVPGPDTLFELNIALNNVGKIESPHILHDMHDYGDHMQQLRFQNVVMDMEKIIFQYSSTKQIFNDLKHAYPIASAAQNFSLGRQLHAINELYPKKNNTLPVTVEVIFGYAICPPKNATNQVKTIPVTLVAP